MDNLLVDLDKVLDDFEAEVNLAPDNESKSSGPQYLEHSYNQTWNVFKNYQPYTNNTNNDNTYISENGLPTVRHDILYHPVLAEKGQSYQPNISDEIHRSVTYDLSYKPEIIDMSDADFAPASNLSGTYNGSISYGKQENNEQIVGNLWDQSENISQTNKNSITVGSTYHKQFIAASPNIKNNLIVDEKLPIQSSHYPIPNTDQMTHLRNGHSLETKNKVHDLNISTKQTSQTQLLSMPSVSQLSPEVDKYPVQCNTPSTPKDNFMVNPLQSQISMNNSKTCVVSGFNAEAMTSQNTQMDMQDIPKFQLLKNDLESELMSTESQESYTEMAKSNLSSYSLPADLHKTMTQHATNLSGSFQFDTHNQFDEKCTTKQLLTEISNLVAFGKLDNLIVENGFEANARNPKQTFEGCKKLNTDHGKVVGFENNFPDVDETDVEAYLVECLKESDAKVTNVSLLAEKNGRSKSGLVNTNEMLMVGEKNCAKLDIVCNYSEDLSFDVKSGVNINGAKIGFDAVNALSQTQKDTVISNSLSEVQELDKDKSDKEIITKLPVSQAIALTTSVPKSVISNIETHFSPNRGHSLDSGCASMTENTEDLYGPDVCDVGARPKDTQSKVNRPNNLMGLSTVDLDLETTCITKPLLAPHNRQLDTDNIISQWMNQNMQIMLVDKETSPVVESRQVMNTSCDEIALQHKLNEVPAYSGDVRHTSWSPVDSDQSNLQKQKRPAHLDLPSPPTIDIDDARKDEISSSVEQELQISTEGQDSDGRADANMETVSAFSGVEASYIPQNLEDLGPPPPYSSHILILGHVPPKWIPDVEAVSCMSCGGKFTFTRRRHHCRACGKVFCNNCCYLKNRLPYLKNQEARVCCACHTELNLASSNMVSGIHFPQAINPSDYGSVALMQAAVGTSLPPSVLVPVLKRDGNIGSKTEGSSHRNEHKQVMFSDGIRPGGDLAELDGSSNVSRIQPKRTRAQKHVERIGQDPNSPRSRGLKTDRTSKCLIPAEGLPPLLVPLENGRGNSMKINPNHEEFMPDIKDVEKLPVIFALNTNLHVSVKITTLDCCVNQTVWCFMTKGMTSVGQEEIVIVLECLLDEAVPPRDIFIHLHNIYEEAGKGNTIEEMGHSLFSQSFLGSQEHGGFLYIRSTFQCVQNLLLPNPPFLFGILLQKWETPWAKVFPLRLLLRLGAEYRYYPCPLIGIRNRKPVFFEIGHTIMNLLADFRNYQYMLPNIRGITIHMEDKLTKINFPRNQYQEVMKVVNNSNEHVMAIAATFSAEADSHLVCIQNDDGNYQTQAINIQNKPRKVTGACFVVFNGALKTSSGLSAKSSIVEDGLMVQITPDSMLTLKQAIHDMVDYIIYCGPNGAPKSDETVIVKWVEDDKNVNIGVKSPVDGMNMDGIKSLRIHNSSDYIGNKYMVRLTEVFFIQNEEKGCPKIVPIDLSRLSKTVAAAFCMALTQHLEMLKESGISRIGLRVSIGADNVGYEAGAKGNRLPDIYMNDLDSELIPIIHGAIQPDTTIVLELIFEVLEMY